MIHDDIMVRSRSWFNRWLIWCQIIYKRARFFWIFRTFWPFGTTWFSKRQNLRPNYGLSIIDFNSYPDCELNVDPPVEGFGKFVDWSFSWFPNQVTDFSLVACFSCDWFVTGGQFWVGCPLDESKELLSSMIVIIQDSLDGPRTDLFFESHRHLIVSLEC